MGSRQRDRGSLSDGRVQIFPGRLYQSNHMKGILAQQPIWMLLSRYRF
jgi:hypothetical protein